MLSAYAMGDLDIEAVMAALRCASPGAAAQRLSVWRGRLPECCWRICETPHCD